MPGMQEHADDTVKRTPLEPEHRELGAKLGPFAGWLMPIEYAGTLSEHRAVREAVGIFDLMHLGKVTIEGADALEVIQRSVTNDVSKVATGHAQYNLMLNERGGIVDDILVYRLGEERYFIVPNAANTEKVHAVLLEEAGEVPVDVVLHPDWCFLAVQGPMSVEVVGGLFPEAGGLSYMQCTQASYRGEPVILSRSGYTGEVGFELFPPERVVHELWEELVEAGQAFRMEPCGLGARDTLRLEMGYPLHGQDISEERTPLEASSAWAVSFDKGAFRGRDALVAQKEAGVPARLWGFRMQDRVIPRAHCAIQHEGRPIGETTSGTFSPTRRMGVALGYVSPRDAVRPGDEVEIEVRGKRGRAVVTKPPFVDSSPRG
jgi:aminomethyltransferase